MITNFGKFNTISNYLSLLRLLVAIPLIFLFNDLEGNRSMIAIILVIIGITDFLDGYLARKFNETTEAGKILDPLADKVAMAIIVVKLYLTGDIPVYLFWMILLRDILIFFGGIFLTRKLGKVMPSNLLGKLAVVILSIYIIAVIFGINKEGFIYEALLILSILFIVISFLGYTLRAIESIRWNKNEAV